ncbi:hypothetical protein JKP88DRAFT_284677 [Tribonema minus]|uniref:Uncharacterized protein n=1 Tax=Tribonema minus TaxID=303371 RepID=A0A836CMK9_9STRA|nr:hypothetical protein JKP88DRAFT_284677 [Tribonema minus]
MGCYHCHFCRKKKVIMRDTACRSCRKAGHKGANDDKARAAQKRGQLKCVHCRKVKGKFAKTGCSGCRNKGLKAANDHKVKAAQKRDQIKCCHCNKVQVQLARADGRAQEDYAKKSAKRSEAARQRAIEVDALLREAGLTKTAAPLAEPYLLEHLEQMTSEGTLLQWLETHNIEFYTGIGTFARLDAEGVAFVSRNFSSNLAQLHDANGDRLAPGDFEVVLLATSTNRLTVAHMETLQQRRHITLPNKMWGKGGGDGHGLRYVKDGLLRYHAFFVTFKTHGLPSSEHSFVGRDVLQELVRGTRVHNLDAPFDYENNRKFQDDRVIFGQAGGGGELGDCGDDTDEDCAEGEGAEHGRPRGDGGG